MKIDIEVIEDMLFARLKEIQIAKEAVQFERKTKKTSENRITLHRLDAMMSQVQSSIYRLDKIKENSSERV